MEILFYTRTTSRNCKCSKMEFKRMKKRIYIYMHFFTLISVPLADPGIFKMTTEMGDCDGTNNLLLTRIYRANDVFALTLAL